MAEAVPFGVAANILTTLGSSAFQEIRMRYGLKKELKKLENTIFTIKAALLDAEERQEKSNLVQNWIRKLKDVVYEADDLLDAFATKALRRKLETADTVKEQVRQFFSSSNPLAFRFKMGHKIREIRERIDEIAADMSKFNFRERIVEIGVQNRERGQTHSFVLTSEVIGRDNDKKVIIDLLMSSSSQENLSLIAIVGIGGLGKTTLAQLIYNDDRVVEFFELRMWVYVSEDFDVKMLVEKLIRSATDEEVGNFDMDQLQRRLRARLDEKRFLIVLDDVWNENIERWGRLKNLLAGGVQGSTIVVTTRSQKVASVMGAKNPYILEGLTEKKSRDLFEQLAFKGRQDKMHPSLITIGKDIVKKCKGVPLAIKTIGSVMQSKSGESEWLSVQNSEIWKLSQDNNDILPVLKLSYDHLPIPLRQCFTYCSIFPKDFRICKETLIQLWMAQGYIQSSGRNERAEDIGDRYFKDLLSRSFFQEAEEGDYGNIESCKMHELIHDLAQTVAGTDCFIAEVGVVDNISDRVHHASLEDLVNSVQNVLRPLLKAKGLRTFLRLTHQWMGESSRRTIISSFRSLRVLDMCGSDVMTLPNSIGKLEHLRYLDLSDNRRMERLPSTVCKLHNLQTLKLSNCRSLTELPRDIRKLINLTHLMIGGCDRLTHMPVGFGKLISLQRIPRFVIGGRRLVRAKGTLNELNGLNHLGGELTLEDLDDVRDAALESKEANLKEKQYLQSLILVWLPGGRDEDQKSELLLDNLQPHPNLKELHVSRYGGIRFSRWLSSITNLVKITIERCIRCEHLPPLDQLPSLKFLSFSHMTAMEYVDDGSKDFSSSSASTSSVFFPSLTVLKLEGLPNLKGWMSRKELVNEAGTMTRSISTTSLHRCERHFFPCISGLTIEDCPKLTSLPLLPNLKNLTLFNSNVEIMVAPEFPKITSATTASSSLALPISSPFPKLEFLRIESVEDCMFFPEEGLRNLTSLKILKIWRCPRLTSLSQGMRHLTALQELEIYHCSNLASLPEGMHHLTSLQMLSISECPHLTERCKVRVGKDWPKITHVPNINIDYRRIQYKD